MQSLDSVLKPLSNNLILIRKNLDNNQYEIEMGIPKDWIFEKNNNIDCEVLGENENGKLIKIMPLNEKVLIDNLIIFAEKIVMVNEEIEKQKVEFEKKMEETRITLINQFMEFHNDMEKKITLSFKEEKSETSTTDKEKSKKRNNKSENSGESNE
jgi:hypothetical protein